MQGIAYDPTNQQLLMVDQGTLQLYAFGASEGFGRVLADLRPLSPAPVTTRTEQQTQEQARRSTGRVRRCL